MLPTPEFCLQMAYELLKDNGDSERANAWATLANAIPAAIDSTLTMKVAWAAAAYQKDRSEEKFEMLSETLDNWRGQWDRPSVKINPPN